MEESDPQHGEPAPEPHVKAKTSAQIVTAESVTAEEVPTIPIGSMQTVDALQPEVAIHDISSTTAARLPAPLIVHPQEYRRSLSEWLRIWWNGIRPYYLPLSLLPLVLGSVLAWTQTITHISLRGSFHPQRFLAALVAVILIQVGAHLINDYYDFVRGIDTSNALGPGGLIQQGIVKPVRVLTLGLVLLGLGALCGLILLLSPGGGALLFTIGLFGLFCAYFYSATSRSLSSMALGELVSFLLFGPLLTVSGYLIQTGQVDRTVLLYSLSPGMLAAAFVHLNNMRDAESDAQAGKHTLASLLDLPLSRLVYLLLLLGAYVPIIALGLQRHGPHLILITLWTLPVLVVLISGVMRTDAPASLHMHMKLTLRLETFFVLLLLAALIITTYWSIVHLPSFTLPI
jgi:1,4-dihydroxy-2-naphthoate octaprenyltransferase